MTIACPGNEGPVVLPFCTPECTRWTQINEGRPITYYHDTSAYDPNYYPALAGLDMEVMFRDAIALWEEHYPCGQLFEEVDNFAAADLWVHYEPTVRDDNLLGTALCFCDAEDEICVRQVDHNEEFGFDKRKSEITMYCAALEQNFLTVPRWFYVMVHEIGHVLGMGHVFTPSTGIQSVMGGDFVLDNGGIFPHDINELQRRYPCGCELTSALRDTFFDGVLKISDENCPVCRGTDS